MENDTNEEFSLKWKTEYEVGIKEIDIQHKRLFVIIDNLNELYKTKQSNLLSVQNEIKHGLNELERYTTSHFYQEEKIMEDNNFPEFEAHVEKHNVFTDKVQEFMVDFESIITEKNEKAFSYFFQELLKFLMDWLKVHIIVEDFKYKPFIKNV